MLGKEPAENFLLSNSWLLLPLGIVVAVRVLVALVLALIYCWNTHIKVRLQPAIPLRKKYGQWAVVTGCTSGIGEHFVHELASKGMDIILVSRSLSKLQKQASQTEKQYGVQTKVIAANYLERDAYKIVQQETKDMDIGLLVNNVGLNTDTGSREFDEMTVEEVRDMVLVNTGAFTIMTKCFLKDMMARGKGAVLNVGSTSGYIVLPMQALYCATKCYMRLLTLAMDAEVNHSGVSIRCSIPQFIKTGMCKGSNVIYNIPFYCCDPRTYTTNTILTLDTPDTAGWWMFDFMIGFMNFDVAILHHEILAPLLHFFGKAVSKISSKVEE